MNHSLRRTDRVKFQLREAAPGSSDSTAEAARAVGRARAVFGGRGHRAVLRVQEAPATHGVPTVIGRGGGALPEMRAAGQRGEVGARPVGLQGHDGADQGGRGGGIQHVLANFSNAGRVSV